ncbi:MAG: MmcQ/YjbR family DNA-binding protein [Acidobacteria bacterium]|nr:MmcQ/YjbR family DNA-binding protein [Acidobacteriota bacterium]
MMNTEQLRKFCLSLPHATEDVKWGNDLCFCVGKKMFAVTGLDSSDGQVSFKCTPDKFAELTEIDGIIPAPYVARYHWVAIQKPNALADGELQDLISNSYKMVFDKLSPKVKKGLQS